MDFEDEPMEWDDTLPIEDLLSLLNDTDAPPITPRIIEDGLETPLLIRRSTSQKQVKIDLRRSELSRLIPALPKPDEIIYLIAADIGAERRDGGLSPRNLQFDFGTLLVHFLELLGNQACWVYGSTWILNEAHVDRMIHGLRRGHIARLVLFMDGFFMSRNPEAAHYLIEGFKPFPQAHFLCFRNHTKLLCVANADQSRAITVTSSANWLSRSRHEQFTLDTSLEVYQAIRNGFFETILKRT